MVQDLDQPAAARPSPFDARHRAGLPDPDQRFRRPPGGGERLSRKAQAGVHGEIAMAETQKAEVEVRMAGAHVAELVWSRPPNNYIDAALVREIADTLE